MIIKKVIKSRAWLQKKRHKATHKKPEKEAKAPKTTAKVGRGIVELSKVRDNWRDRCPKLTPRGQHICISNMLESDNHCFVVGDDICQKKIRNTAFRERRRDLTDLAKAVWLENDL